MKLRTTLIASVLFALIAGSAAAADIVGKWNSTFDSQIGEQKYVYEFTTTDGVLSGKATRETTMGNGTADLTKIKVDGDNITFVETLSFDGNDLVITYTGTISGNEMKLKREVGEFAVEQIVAKRSE